MYGNDKTVEILRGVAEKTKNKMAQSLLKDEEFDAACSAARFLVDEAIDMVKDGSMKWKDAVEDLHENLKAISMPESVGSSADDDEQLGRIKLMRLFSRSQTLKN